MAVFKRVFKSRVFKGVARGFTVRSLLGSLGGAALAGIGWKIGADVYDAVTATESWADLLAFFRAEIA